MTFNYINRSEMAFIQLITETFAFDAFQDHCFGNKLSCSIEMKKQKILSQTNLRSVLYESFVHFPDEHFFIPRLTECFASKFDLKLHRIKDSFLIRLSKSYQGKVL